MPQTEMQNSFSPSQKPPIPTTLSQSCNTQFVYIPNCQFQKEHKISVNMLQTFPTHIIATSQQEFIWIYSSFVSVHQDKAHKIRIEE